MNLNDYRMNAYKSAGAKPKSEPVKPAVSTKTAGSTKQAVSSKSLTSAKTTVSTNTSPTKNSDSIRQTSTAKPGIIKTGSKYYDADPQVKTAAEALTHGGLLKVPAPEKGKEDVYRRVAKFLILIGVDQAALVLKHLTQEETEKIIPEITATRSIDPDEANEILEEFNSLVERVREGGGSHTAQLILEKAFGKQRAQDLMNHLNVEEEQKPFVYLADKQPEQILALLKDEANSVRALVFSYLPPQKAADVINRLNDSDKKEVILNLAKSKKVLPEVIKSVDKTIHEKSLAQVEVKTNTIDGKSILAEILKKMDFKSEQDILSTIKDDNPELGEELQEKLFTVEDVLNSDDRFIQNYLRELTDVEIAYLIGDKDNNFRSKIFHNMSIGRADAVLEEEAVHKPMLKKDCNEITQRFFAHLRHAWEDGELMIKGRDDDEYV